MKKRLIALTMICALILSSCGGKEEKTAATTETSRISETKNISEFMMTYKDKTVSESYYEYLLSITKYDFLDTYLEYSRKYAERGLNFGQAYFGTEVADTEDFWNAPLDDNGSRVTVADVIKKQTLNFAKCVIVFDSIMSDTGFCFTKELRQNAEAAVKSRCGATPETVLSKLGVAYDEALYAELVSQGTDGLKTFVTGKGKAAEVTDKMVEEELSSSVRYKAVSYYGPDKSETDEKAKASYERIISGAVDFETELKNSDDYYDLIDEHADGTLLSLDEFCETFGINAADDVFKPGYVFTASNESGSYVIMITDFTDADRENAFSAVSTRKFSEFLKNYTSGITISEEALDAVDFFKAARISG